MAVDLVVAIRALEVQYSLSGLNDVVVEVAATLSGRDFDRFNQIHTAVWSGGFRVAPPDPDTFIPFADLTEADAEGFMKATSTYTTVHNALTSQIWQEMQPPTQGTLPLPWE